VLSSGMRDNGGQKWRGLNRVNWAARLVLDVGPLCFRLSMEMLSPCDGCERVFTTKLTLVTAKEWKPSLCDVSVAEAPACKRFDCPYNIEGGCNEFQFCDSCLASQETINRTFATFHT
jgi:hypothetical protein